MAALRTEQLECMLKCLMPSSGAMIVLGVFPADRVPLRAYVGADGTRTLHTSVDDKALSGNAHYAFILNTHPHDQPGEHWLAFVYNTHTRILEYFDSFGMALPMYVDIYTALDKCNLTILCRPVNGAGMLQSVTSTICGHYCVVFLCWRAKHCTSPPTQFSLIVAMVGTCDRRDRHIVQVLNTLLSRANCCHSALPHSLCTQTCTCRHI